MTIAQLIQMFAAQADFQNRLISVNQLQRLQTFFNNQQFTTLRIFVSRASGFGHQANTVTVIKRFINLGFTKTIQVIYDTTPGQGTPTTIEKLAVLLPGLQAVNPQPYLLDGVQLTFHPFDDSNRIVVFQDSVPLCVNGGAENEDNLCDYFNVKSYLQLQPYKWVHDDAPNALWVQGNPERIMLTAQPQLGDLSFTERAFFVQIPPQHPIDWNQLRQIPDINIQMLERSKVVCDCFQPQPLRDIDFYPIYGLPLGEGRKAIPGTPKSIVYVSATASALLQPTRNKPIVIALLSEVEEGLMNSLADMFKTVPLPFDDVSDPEDADDEFYNDDDDQRVPNIYSYGRRIEERTRQWVTGQGIVLKSAANPNGRIQLLYEPTGPELAAAIAAATNNTIIITTIKKAPQILFNHFYSISTLPGIFEGQGTANYVLNTGKPYFQMAKQNINPFPSGVLLPAVNVAITDRMKDVIFRLQYGISSFTANDNPARSICDLMQECLTANTPEQIYFTQIGQFYHAEENDKLLLSLLWWLTIYNPDQLGEKLIADADNTVLQNLFAALNSNYASGAGVLQLFQVLRNFNTNGTSTILSYLSAITGSQNFQIGVGGTQVSIDFDPAKPEDGVKVLGRTDGFVASVSLTIKLVFKLANDKKSINTSLDLDIGDFNLPDIEWFKIKEGKILATVPGDGGRIFGKASLKIEFGDTLCDFKVDFPVKEKLLLFSGDFPVNQPDLDKVFQVLGGIDFAQSLPDPIKVITKTGLRDFEFIYDYDDKKVESFKVHLINQPPTPWTLIGKLKLSELDMNISVVDPTAQRKVSWNASSSFQIGNGFIDVIISYPDLAISALLRKGEENKIGLGDLFTFFLPETTTLNIPATLSDFVFNMNPSKDALPSSYLLQASLQSDQWDGKTKWSVMIGQHLFALEEIKVEIESKGNEQNSRDTTGYLMAVLTLFGSATDPSDAVTLNLSARYLGTDKGWLFFAKQGEKPIKVIKLIATYVDQNWASGDIPQLDLNDLCFQMATGGTSQTENAYLLSGKINAWADTPLGEIKVDIKGEFGYFAASKNPFKSVPTITNRRKIELRNNLLLQKGLSFKDPETLDFNAFVEGDINWNGIELKVFFDYNKDVQKFGLEWNGLVGYIEKKGEEYEAKLTFSEDTTIGSIVETMISWATGTKFGLGTPWNLLNGIGLSNLELVYTFKKVNGKMSDGKVSLNVNIGPFDLGIATLKGFRLSYNNGEEYLTDASNAAGKEVIVTLEGSFFWQSGDGNGTMLATDEPLSWNAANPSDTKAPPGDGNKYFDLKYLGMGQHVTFPGITSARTIQEAMDIMEKAPAPEKDKLPAVAFDPKSNWLIGADFCILKLEEEKKGAGNANADEEDNGYFLTAQIVFNDPYLYGLRLALAGKPAKILKGLDFQIMYRQINETVGVYQAEITLPDYMRRLTIGAYTIVLPVFGISVYTNGDFLIDVGFPWNQNFSRSLTIEAMIPPGIPVLGSAGFYFGKLSGETSDKVPVASNGTFNPVIVFGFGFQVGLGKSFEAGILKAGFSLTLLAIIEGVIAKWNPYLPQVSNSDDQVQGQYYFYLSGTLGISGKLYGSIDFAIIKAEVNIELALMAQIIYESFEPIVFTVFAKVRATATVIINLGLFKINIDFSFQLDLKQTIYIENAGTKPWNAPSVHRNGILRQPMRRRLYNLNMSNMKWEQFEFNETLVPNWNNLIAATTRDELDAYIGFIPTLAGESATAPNQQIVCLTTSLLLSTDPVPSGSSHNYGLLKSSGLMDDKAIDKLSKKIVIWCIAAARSRQYSIDEMLDSIVTETEIKGMLAYLDQFENNPAPIPIDDIETFLSNQFIVKASIPSDQTTSINGTYFPIPPKLKFKASSDAYPQQQGYEYTYKEYNSLSADYLQKLRSYFNDIAVQVQEEDNFRMGLIAEESANSLSEFIMTDYFLLIARHMLRALNSGLRNFIYPIPADKTVAEILHDINEKAGYTQSPEFSCFDLFEDNASHPLNDNTVSPVSIQIGGGQYYQLFNSVGKSFQDIARLDYNQDFTGFDLAIVNLKNKVIKKAITITVEIDGLSKTYLTPEISSLEDIAVLGFSIDVPMLLRNSDLLTREDIFETTDSNIKLSVPYFKMYVVAGNNSFDNIAALGFGTISSVDIARLNAAVPVIQTGAVIQINRNGTLIREYVTKPEDSLYDIARGLSTSAEKITLEDLFTTDVNVLSNTALLLETGLLMIPSFMYTIASNDTFTVIADKFSVSIQMLADNVNNLSILNLFSVSQPNLNISHLSQFKFRDLLDETQRGGSIEQMAAMISRYYFHSLRLPTNGITPHKKGMWVNGDGENNPYNYAIADAGLFALCGQQFPAPLMTDSGPDFNIEFDTNGDFPWLKFLPDNGNRIGYSIKSTDPSIPSYQNYLQIKSLSGYATDNKVLNTGLIELVQSKMYKTDLVSFAFSQPGTWLSGNKFVLPYSLNATSYNQFQVWRLPDGLINLVCSDQLKVLPRFKVQKGAYNEASGKTDATDIHEFAWSSIFKTSVKKIMEVDKSPNTKYTYEILGSGGNDLLLLDNMIRNAADINQHTFSIVVSFGAENTGNDQLFLKSDDLSALTFGTNKINLTTDTNPPAFLLADFDDNQGRGLINLTSSDFIKLIWEASITRSGGFYLYYFNSSTGTGLPDEIFNDKNEATLYINLIYKKPEDPASVNRLLPFVNQFITGETFDLSKYSVFALGEYVDISLNSSSVTMSKITLSDLVADYLGNIDDIALKNKDQYLRIQPEASNFLKIRSGIFMVSPLGGPNTLSQIATHFNLLESAIRDANPKIHNWNGTLSNYLSIRLPDMTLQIRDNEANGLNTLQSIASYFSINIVALAWDNMMLKGIFADAATISFAGCAPSTDNPVVPAGVIPYTAKRSVSIPPAAQSVDPATFADQYLPSTYTMLGFNIIDNQDFESSDPGLPVAPTSDKTDAGKEFKVNFVKQLDATSEWNYDLAIKYINSLKSDNFTGAELISPYAGIGKLLQVDFRWEDLAGNKIISDLDNPSSGSAGITLNRQPVIAPYTDTIVGLSKWPAVSPCWFIEKIVADQKINFNLHFNFDASIYEGLLRAEVSAEQEVSLYFSISLDTYSAEDITHYLFSGGIEIVKAKYETTNKKVRLTTAAPVLPANYEVFVNDIKTAKGLLPVFVISGSATFSTNGSLGSSLAVKAKKDAQAYNLLLNQVNDPNGIRFKVKSSLFSNEIIFNSTDFDKLQKWIEAIATYINSRAQLKNVAVVPDTVFDFNYELKEQDFNTQELYILKVEFEFERLKKIIAPGMGPQSGILINTSYVQPKLVKLQDNKDDALALSKFTKDLEAACSFTHFFMKVGTGVDRSKATTTNSGGELWIVRFGKDLNYGISAAINETVKPVVFSPRPVANELKSQSVDIMPYVSGQVLNPNATEPPKQAVNFTDIDVDVWMAQFLLTMDEILSAEFISAIQLLQMINAADVGNIMAELLDQKKKLAGLIKKSLILFYADETNNQFIDQAQDMFEQQLLESLSNAYSTRAAIQYEVSVNADIEEELSNEPPKLFGPIVKREIPFVEGADIPLENEIHLSSPKLNLIASSKEPLTILLSGPAVVKGKGGEIIPSFPLKLSYQPSFIEHQIGESYSGDGYRPSSWLNFILPENVPSYELEECNVPSYLRAFPGVPSLISHRMCDYVPVLNAGETIISDIIKWDYEFTYSMNIHYPHDTVYCKVDFNKSQMMGDAINYNNLFGPVAQFIAVGDQVYQDLENNLLKIVPATQASDPAVIAASTAIRSFKNLVQYVIDGADSVNGFVIPQYSSMNEGITTLPFNCNITESSVEINGVTALLVSVIADKALNLGKTIVRIEGYKEQVYLPKLNNRATGNNVDLFEYFFIRNGTTDEILSAKDGQEIPERKIVITDMDIVRRQNACATIFVKRNEFTKDDGIRRNAAAPFVYSSGEVKFNSALLPTIENDSEIDIASISAISLSNKVNKLSVHLMNFLIALLKNNDQNEVVIQMACSYVFSINDALNAPVPVPLMFNPPETVTMNAVGLNKLVNKWSDAITDRWYKAYTPVDVKKGKLHFDITIMSDKGVDNKPYALVHLPNLILKVQDISNLPPAKDE